jgi:hypothetical protein
MIVQPRLHCGHTNSSPRARSRAHLRASWLESFHLVGLSGEKINKEENKNFLAGKVMLTPLESTTLSQNRRRISSIF